MAISAHASPSIFPWKDATAVDRMSLAHKKKDNIFPKPNLKRITWEKVGRVTLQIFKYSLLTLGCGLTIFGIFATPPSWIFTSGLLVGSILILAIRKIWEKCIEHSRKITLEKNAPNTSPSTGKNNEVLAINLDVLTKYEEKIDKVLASNADGSLRNENEISMELRLLLDDINREVSDGIASRITFADGVIDEIEIKNNILKLISASTKIAVKINAQCPNFLDSFAGAVSFTKDLGCWIELGMESYRCHLRKIEIQREEDKRKFLLDQLKEIDDPFTVRHLLREIANLDKIIFKLKMINSKKERDFHEHLALGVIQGSQEIIKLIQKQLNYPIQSGVSKALSYSHSGFSFAHVFMHMGINISKIVNAGESLHKSSNRIKKLTTQLQLKKPQIIDDIIKLKIDHCKCFSRKQKFAIGERTVKLVSNFINISSPIRSVLLTAGVVLSAQSLLAFTILGIVSAALILKITILNLVVDLWKKRGDIKYFFQTIGIPASRSRVAFRYRKCNKQQEKALIKVNHLRQIQEKTISKKLSKAIKKQDCTILKTQKQMDSLKHRFLYLHSRQEKADDELKWNSLCKIFCSTSAKEIKEMYKKIEECLKDPYIAKKIASLIRKNGGILQSKLTADEVFNFITSDL